MTNLGKCLVTIIKLMVLNLILSMSSYATPPGSISDADRDAVKQFTSSFYSNNSADINIHLLQGGYSGDKVLLIEVNSDKSVMRLHKPGKTKQLLELEWLCTSRASQLGIGPSIKYHSSDYDILVTNFVEGLTPNVATFSEQQYIKTLGNNLKQFHESGELPRQWSVFSYIERLLSKKPKMLQERFKQAKLELDNLSQLLEKANFPKKPCHNDIQMDNIFIQNDKLLLIDWGDAGMSDPFWDLARASMEFGFDEQKDTLLLSSYLESITQQDLSHFYLMKQIFLARTAIALSGEKGMPNPNKLSDVSLIFANNGYDISKDGEPTWDDISGYALTLFLENIKSTQYIKHIEQLSK